MEGAEDRVLAPYLRDAPPTMWPRLVILEDSRDRWRTDLFELLETCDYRIVARSRLNVMFTAAGEVRG